MLHVSLLAVLALAGPMAHAEEEGVVFAVGAERFVLTPACVLRVEHAMDDDGLVHLRFDMPETPPCFGAFHGLLSSHLSERLAITYRGQTLVEADLHARLGPRNIVLVSRRARLAVEAGRFLGGLPNREVP
ncbi:MAG: hypothetical protein R3215_03095 [Halomonas sp.]|nr:hypothetical protein [Halomonas sp.]